MNIIQECCIGLNRKLDDLCIKKKQTYKYPKDEYPMVKHLCGVCEKDMNTDNDKIKNNNCNHYFHNKCIIKWKKYSKLECPICDRLL